MDRTFLDANVLFSAAWRSDSGLLRLWQLKGARLLTSAYAAEEARVNLPREEQRRRLEDLLGRLEMVATPSDLPLPRNVTLPDKDRPILLAALAAQATHLLTGDVDHFGAYYGRKVGGLIILRPSEYLRRFGPRP